MQAQNTSSAVEQDEQIDTAIMGMLFDSPRPLAVAEIECEVANPLHVEDGIARLVAVGLAHRLGELVFATRAVISPPDWRGRRRVRAGS